MNSLEKGPSQRQLKVGEEVRQALSDIFMKEDFYDPDTFEEISITISEARISPDLRNATIFAMPLGGKDKDKMEATLNRMAPKIRSMLARKVRMKFLPALYFKLDTTFDRASEVEQILNLPKVRQDLEK